MRNNTAGSGDSWMAKVVSRLSSAPAARHSRIDRIVTSSSCAMRGSSPNFRASSARIEPGRTAPFIAEEARKFGLDPRMAHELLVTMRSILEWRAAGAELKRDTTFAIHESPDPAVLFRIPLPRTNYEGRILGSGSASEMVWNDVTDRPIGLDHENEHRHSIRVEIFDGVAPSV